MFVEGTAMEVLPFMENFDNNRPEYFPSIKKELNICLEVEQLKIYKVQESVPRLLEEIDNNGKKFYKFKTNLMASKKYWNDCFICLSKSFLYIKVPKTLMLAELKE